MAMQFTLESFVEFIAAISSLFIGTFFILVSVFNQDIKAFIYLAGAPRFSAEAYSSSQSNLYSKSILSYKPLVASI